MIIHKSDLFPGGVSIQKKHIHVASGLVRADEVKKEICFFLEKEIHIPISPVMVLQVLVAN